MLALLVRQDMISSVTSELTSLASCPGVLFIAVYHLCVSLPEAGIFSGCLTTTEPTTREASRVIDNLDR